jgi:hypothetical protein
MTGWTPDYPFERLTVASPSIMAATISPFGG